MKTKQCKPVLVNSKELVGIWKNSEYKLHLAKTLTRGRTYNLYDWVPQQLILISLDSDEKIEKGDGCICLDEIKSNSLPENKNNQVSPFVIWESTNNCNGCKKVIATQDQLSPEYINKFIEEYNTEKVEDVEIEMELNGAYMGHFEGVDCSDYKPKLTKEGFVTIVNKAPINEKALLTEFLNHVSPDPIEENESIYFPIKVDENIITLYGAGKFGEEKLILNKTKASLLFIELWKFLDIGNKKFEIGFNNKQ